MSPIGMTRLSMSAYWKGMTRLFLLFLNHCAIFVIFLSKRVVLEQKTREAGHHTGPGPPLPEIY
jgi:hypothetical protein